MQSQPKSEIGAELKSITKEKESLEIKYEEKIGKLSVLNYLYKQLEYKNISLKEQYKKISSEINSLVAEVARQKEDY